MACRPRRYAPSTARARAAPRCRDSRGLPRSESSSGSPSPLSSSRRSEAPSLTQPLLAAWAGCVYAAAAERGTRGPSWVGWWWWTRAVARAVELIVPVRAWAAPASLIEAGRPTWRGAWAAGCRPTCMRSVQCAQRRALGVMMRGACRERCAAGVRMRSLRGSRSHHKVQDNDQLLLLLSHNPAGQGRRVQ